MPSGRDDRYVRSLVFDHVLEKRKVYIRDYSEVPEGAQVNEGPRGGTYYTTESIEQFADYIRDSARKMMAEHDFSEEQLEAAKETRDHYLGTATDEFVEMMHRAGDNAIGGSYRVKTIPSMMEKVYHRKADKYDHPQELDDVLGMRVFASDPHSVQAVGEQVKEAYGDAVFEYEDYVDNPKDGYYRSIHVGLELDDGRKAEVQIKSPEMFEVIESGHALVYKDINNLEDDEKEEIQECLTQVMDRLYGEAEDIQCTSLAARLISDYHEENNADPYH